MFFIQPQYSITIYYCFCTTLFISFPAYIKHIYIAYSRIFRISNFIFCLILFFYPILIEANLSWLIYESIKALEIKTLTVSYLAFPINTILSRFFLFFLAIDLYFIIPEVIPQSFNPTTELVILMGLPTKEANAEFEAQLLTTEMKRKEYLKTWSSLNSYTFFMPFAYQAIMSYFLLKVISCFLLL